MGRLSNSVREEMARALVRHRFTDDANALIVESLALFKVVLNDQYDEKTRKAMTILESAHRGAFPKRDSLTVNVGGRRILVGSRHLGRDSGSNISWRAEAESCILLNRDDRSERISYLDGEIAARLIAFSDTEDKLRSQVGLAYRKALGALAQFSTGKRLAEDWPEAMPIIGKIIPESDRQLPVVQVAALNAEFDLPPERKAA